MIHEVAGSGQLALSAVVINRNETQRTERCLASLCFDDKIMVVDADSDDDTVARAKGRAIIRRDHSEPAKRAIESHQSIRLPPPAQRFQTMKVLVAGTAGFIGMHVVQGLLARGDKVVGVNNLNAYYDVAPKEARLGRLAGHPGFRLVRLDVADAEALSKLFRQDGFQPVVHLAAQAGVRTHSSTRRPTLHIEQPGELLQ